MSELTVAEPQQKSRAADWWRSVCGPASSDPAARARLKRCRTTNDVLSIPAAVRLAVMLGALPSQGDHVDERFGRALDLARVLAHVTAETDAHPMREVGWPTFPGTRRESDMDYKPRLSESRFRRLLQSDNGEDLVAQFTRLIDLMDGRCNVAAVSSAFLYWNHPDGWIKQRWAFQYFNAGQATPSINDSAEDADE